ncbi:hypothetical protein DFH09DRAFT_1069603 [Mycena vulgaris]|nr:hypothetical protein DFH09DRAFT_1069603 [Mycena vulgaris]
MTSFLVVVLSKAHSYLIGALPPTINTLSLHQRSHLRPSTQKLRRLGSTRTLIEPKESMPDMCGSFSLIQCQVREYSPTQSPTSRRPAPHAALLHLDRQRRLCAVPSPRPRARRPSPWRSEYLGGCTKSAHVATADRPFLRIAPRIAAPPSSQSHTTTPRRPLLTPTLRHKTRCTHNLTRRFGGTRWTNSATRSGMGFLWASSSRRVLNGSDSLRRGLSASGRQT